MAEPALPPAVQSVSASRNCLVRTGLQGEQHQEIAEDNGGDRAPEERECQTEPAVPFQGMRVQTDHGNLRITAAPKAVDDGMVEIPGFADPAALWLQKSDVIRIRLRVLDQCQNVPDNVDSGGTIVLGYGREGLPGIFLSVRNHRQPVTGGTEGSTKHAAVVRQHVRKIDRMCLSHFRSEFRSFCAHGKPPGQDKSGMSPGIR